jgi:3-hydroxymyristoyl/3-hydroxydecanoyl-(acyl carrier protein) dehydratase
VTVGDDGCFMLGKRKDRVVKIEEKRVSLDQVEAHLLDCVEVSAAHVLTLPGRRQQRDSLACVVVLTELGWAELYSDGKQKFNQRLRDALRPHLDAMALPRRWRYVRHMPITPQGKVRKIDLASLFLPDQGQKVSPSILSRETDGDELILRLCPEADLFYFDGHFDAGPVLAGVVQIDWAIQFAKEHFGISEGLQRMDALKFFRIIPPEQEVTLSLRFSQEKGVLQFNYFDDEIKYSSGRIGFGERR